MISKRSLLAVLIAGLGMVTTAAYARHGADDPVDACDDHGTNLCYQAVQMAKNGADNPVEVEGIDDNGMDFVVAKHGADNPIEIEGPDDNGTDIVARQGADNPVEDEGLDDHGAA